MHGAYFKPGRACLRPLENFLQDPKPQKNSKICVFRSIWGSNSLLKMKILDVVTLEDDSDSLIRRITPKPFFSFTPMSRGPEDSKIIL